MFRKVNIFLFLINVIFNSGCLSFPETVRTKITQLEYFKSLEVKARACIDYLNSSPKNIYSILSKLSDEEKRNVFNKSSFPVKVPDFKYSPYSKFGYVRITRDQLIYLDASQYLTMVCAETLNKVTRFSLSRARYSRTNNELIRQWNIIYASITSLRKLINNENKYIRMYVYLHVSPREINMLEWWEESLKTHKLLSNDSDPNIRMAAQREAELSARIIIRYEQEQKNREYQQNLLREKLKQ